MNARLPAARDEGFTLIELLISISILGIIMAALGAALYLGLKNTDITNNRMLESHDEQVMSVYFPEDAASATGVRRDVTTCAEATAGGETAVVFFKWTEAGVAKAAGYFTKTVGAEKQLIRRKCSAGAMVSEPIMSHYITTANPTIACTPAPTTTSCPVSGTGAAFTSVSISVTEVAGHAYTLTGSKRSV